MKVLFVDDEPRVLEAIERVLSELDVAWEPHFVQSGRQALNALAAQPIDVIVSDMRMPEMDGAALLSEVCERYPSVVRIVLSGQIDEDSALKAVPVAHQFLAKPCAATTLRRVIESTHGLASLLADAKLRAVIGQIDQLPSPPRLFIELSRLLEDESSDVARAAAVIEQDPGMASKLLQVANSAFFASATTVLDIRRAVVRLGLRTLRSLALGLGVFEDARSYAPTFSAQIDEIQRRSLAVARLSKRIASGSSGEAAFMSGLVCDVGRLVLAKAAPERMQAARRVAEEQRIELHQAEHDLWGVSHAEIGAFLLGVWGLPFPIVEAVANHHTPERNAHDHLGLPQAVWLSACMVEGQKPDPTLITRFEMTEALERAVRASPAGSR